MKMDSFARIFTLLFLLLVMPVASASAQGEQSVPVVTKRTAAPVQAQSMPPEPDSEVTILRDEYAGKYNPTTLEKLAQLYWRLGAFDMEDTEAVGNFIKINECKLFAEYVNDDLEWKEIVRTMKSHLQKHRDSYPVNFQFVLQLHLGRYDPVLGGFPIVDKTGFKNAKRIEVDSIDRNRDICFDANPIKDYPKSLIILLPKPFTLDFLKLDEHVAQAYILRKKSEFSEMTDAARLQRYERDAYLRLRVTFSQYHGNLRGDAGLPMAILYGKIDGYEIFEDSKQKRMMLSVNLEEAKAAATPEMSVPVKPLSDLAEAPEIEAAPVQTTTTTTTTVVETPVMETGTTAVVPATAAGFAATPSP